MHRLILLAFLLLSSFSNNLSAQSENTTAAGPNVDVSIDDSWTIFHDEDSKTYFIDFETISRNLREIVVSDKTGDIVFRDHVGNLPVNSIYELDYSTFASGIYNIELRSYTSSMMQELEVR